MTNGAAIEALMQGPKVRVVETFDVTVPEGLSRREAARALQESGIEGSYLKASGSTRALARARQLGLPRGTDTTRGLPLPGDVRAARRRDRARPRRQAARRVRRQLRRRSTWRRRSARTCTRYDIVIIASLIERETPSDKERPLIASVIYNRLRQDITLGIDATIRYAENNWTEPLKQSELDRPGPYNTRQNLGLPPTPIGNPGLASLKAAANPARTDYLFYVAKPGACHAFSSTDAEFARDVAAYNRAREENGGKAPPQKC